MDVNKDIIKFCAAADRASAGDPFAAGGTLHETTRNRVAPRLRLAWDAVRAEELAKVVNLPRRPAPPADPPSAA